MGNRRKKRGRMKWICGLAAAVPLVAGVVYIGDFSFQIWEKGNHAPGIWLTISMIISIIAVVYFIRKYGKKE